MPRDDADPRPPHRKRCHRINAPGHAHALTFSCFRRQPFLSKERSCLWMIEAIDQARARHGFHLWAYVLMPEHVHLLILPADPHARISEILSSVKQPVAKRAARFIRRHAPEFLPRMTDRQPNGRATLRFWQRGGGYDRNIWDPRYIRELIDYIHANPVRRGLCPRPQDWRWSSAGDHLGIGGGPLSLDTASLPSGPHG